MTYGAQLGAQKDKIPLTVSQANLVLPVGKRVLGRNWAESLTAVSGNAQPMFGLVVEVR